MVIPRWIDSRSSDKKVYFFASNEFTTTFARSTSGPNRLTDRARTSRRGRPGGPERPGDKRNLQVILDPRDRAARFPGNIIPQGRLVRWA